MTKRAPRRKRCPYCGSRNTGPILYGMIVPDPDDPLPDHAVLGGCVIMPGQPMRHCHSCGRGYDFRPGVADDFH
jgi:hypothetical protein